MSAVKALTKTLHTICCNKHHAEDMKELLQERNPKLCYFYLEESMADGDTLPDHIYWKRVVDDICKEMSTTPEEALTLLAQLLKIRGDIERFKMRYPNALSLMRRVLDSFAEHS